jgi:hypothetical protein
LCVLHFFLRYPIFSCHCSLHLYFFLPISPTSSGYTDIKIEAVCFFVYRIDVSVSHRSVDLWLLNSRSCRHAPSPAAPWIGIIHEGEWVDSKETIKFMTKDTWSDFKGDTWDIVQQKSKQNEYIRRGEILGRIFIFLRYWGLNLGPCACLASILSHQPYP